MIKHIRFLGDCCEIITGSTLSRLISEYWNGDIKMTSPEKITQSGIE